MGGVEGGTGRRGWGRGGGRQGRRGGGGQRRGWRTLLGGQGVVTGVVLAGLRHPANKKNWVRERKR